MVWRDRGPNPRSTALERNMLTITPLMGFLYLEDWQFVFHFLKTSRIIWWLVIPYRQVMIYWHVFIRYNLILIGHWLYHQTSVFYKDYPDDGCLMYPLCFIASKSFWHKLEQVCHQLMGENLFPFIDMVINCVKWVICVTSRWTMRSISYRVRGLGCKSW